MRAILLALVSMTGPVARALHPKAWTPRCMKLGIVFNTSVVLAVFASSASAGNGLFGVVASDGTVACVAFAGFNQTLPASVRIVLPDAPQQILAAVVVSKLSKACKAIDAADMPGPYFEACLSG